MKNARHLSRMQLMAALFVVPLLVFASCGGDDDAAPSVPRGDVERGVERAREELKPYRELRSDIGITDPLTELPTGKTVAFMECGVPNCKILGDDIESAAETLGITLERISIGNTPEDIGRGFGEAVQNAPDGIIVPSTPRELWAQYLVTFEEMGIPVVTTGVTGPADGALKKTYFGDAVFEQSGEALANWTIVDSKGSANVLYLNTPIFQFVDIQLKAAQRVYEENCPECTLDSLDLQPDEVGSTIPGKVVSYLQQHPDTNYVVGGFGGLLLGVPEALRAAGFSDQVVLSSVSGTAPNWEFIRDGEQASDLTVPLNYMGWTAVDGIARAMVGDETSLAAIEDTELPWFTLITKRNLTWGPDEQDPVLVPGYKKQFEALWGVK